MLHTYAAKFDVMENLENILVFRVKNKAFLLVLKGSNDFRRILVISIDAGRRMLMEWNVLVRTRTNRRCALVRDQLSHPTSVLCVCAAPAPEFVSVGNFGSAEGLAFS